MESDFPLYLSLSRRINKKSHTDLKWHKGKEIKILGEL